MSPVPDLPTKVTGTARFDAAASALGIAPEIRVFDRSTRTAADAAAAIGCPVAAIAKSLVFRGVRAPDAGAIDDRDGREAAEHVILAIASGPNRVDPAKVAALLAPRTGPLRIEKASADWVRAMTGYAIGGVAPIGSLTHAVPVLDADLARLDTVWAAAGTPNRVARFAGGDLAPLIGAIVGDLSAAG